MVKWGRLFINMQSFFKKHFIFTSSRICVPYYFEEHSRFLRSRFHFPKSLNIFKSLHCLLFYFGEHCIFVRSCLYLPFYHVWLWWRKSYNSLCNQNIPWKKSTPPPTNVSLFSRNASCNPITPNDQCSWLS